MSVSDAQWVAWLRSDGSRRTLLVVAESHDGSTTHTHYWGTRPVISQPTDTPANTPFEDVIDAVPAFRWALDDALQGATTHSWGELRLYNDGGLDYLLNHGWEGHPIAFYLGDLTWPFDDYRQILGGFTESISCPDKNQLALSLRGRQYALDVPLQTDTIASGPHAGEIVPDCWGEVFNGEPVLIDAATLKYRIHSGPVQAITDVRDNGVSVAYTADLPNGEFTLSNNPAGAIRFDAQGGTVGGAYLSTAGEIFEHLITDRTILTSSDLDSSAIATFKSTCTQTVGYYAAERQNLLDVLDWLVISVGGYYGERRDGKIFAARLEAPTGTASIEYDTDSVVRGGIRLRKRWTPRASIRLGYRRNWGAQNAGAIAASVTTANRDAYSTEWQETVAEDATIKTQYPLAEDPERIDTLLVDATEAATEASRQLTLWKQPRYLYELDALAEVYRADAGDEVEITHPRFGFDAGENAIAVGGEDNPTKRRGLLEVWR